ncbi:hypothetical protein [Jiella sonneratiae]|uniref:Uncharacterized protein n=1 Tax=Jiella sonneratiae TaxID=2816856 RepID=A0ABS3J7Y2_9HYPH|nr:hypothetical protein [Jiella sonneratiae]MBO0905781.1 hypothetical protein [Jiella sonneratiae]
MLLLVSGSHSAYSRFGFAAVQAIARAAYGTIQPAQFSKLEQFYSAYRDRKSETLVAFIQAGDERIARLLQRTQSKIVLFEDDLTNTVGRLMIDPRHTFRKAVCSATMASASLTHLAETTNAVVYPCPMPQSLMLPFIQSLAWFFGIEPDQALVDKVAVSMKLGSVDPRTSMIEAMDAFASDYADTQAVLKSFAPQHMAIMEALRRSYGTRASEDARKTLSWPIQALFDPRNREDFLPDEIEMQGKARTLISGPEYRLVPGSWLTEVVLGINDNRSGNKMVWTIVEGKAVRARLNFELPSEGRLKLTQAFDVEDPCSPVSFIFDIKEGAIEGRLSIQSIRLRRLRQQPVLAAEEIA